MPATVLDKPVFEPCWLSFVASTTAVLRALGADVDAVDVAGRTAYAFHLTVNRGLCPSGPTCVSWSGLSEGALGLGRSVTFFSSWDAYAEGFRNDRTRAHAREAFELARREVEAGRPCVVWGIGIPEFSVVYGVTDDDEYVAVPWGPVPETCAWDAVEAPGGPAVFAFPTERCRHPGEDRAAVRAALLALNRPDEGAHGRCGVGAYEYWIDELAGGRASRMGHSYNAQCWAEARAFARDFTGRLAERTEGDAAEHLGRARDAFAAVADALADVAARFPLTFEAGEVPDGEDRLHAIERLRAARRAEPRAIDALASALSAWPST